jgi:hypothetical protein
MILRPITIKIRLKSKRSSVSSRIQLAPALALAFLHVMYVKDWIAIGTKGVFFFFFFGLSTVQTSRREHRQHIYFSSRGVKRKHK